MRIGYFSPVLGDNFGQEKVMRSTLEALKELGHSVLLIGCESKGQLPPCDQALLIPELQNFRWYDSREKKQSCIDQVLSAIENFGAEIVHFVDLFDQTLMNAVLEKHRCVYTAHTFAASCPASTRRTLTTTVCDRKSGISCLRGHRKNHCLSHFKNDIHRLNAILEHTQRKNSVRRFHRVFCISKTIESALMRDQYHNLKYLPNPVHRTRPHNEVKKERGLIICASRLVPHKGVQLLLEALNELKDVNDWKAIICGEGPLASALKTRLKALELEDRVSLPGQTTYTEMETLMEKASIYVQPNTGPEPFGLSPAEAMLHETAVVATNTPALNEFIHHEKNGLLCDPNAPSLAHQIRRLLENNDLSERLAKQASLDIERDFSTEKHIYQLLYEYRDIISSPGTLTLTQTQTASDPI